MKCSIFNLRRPIHQGVTGMGSISTVEQPIRRLSTTTHITMQAQDISGITEILAEPRGAPIPIATTFRKMTIGKLRKVAPSLLYPILHQTRRIFTEIPFSITLRSGETPPLRVSTLDMPRELGRMGR